MTRSFGHLSDATPYPGDETRVYEQHENSFDYTRWKPNTSVRLCHVNFTDDYHDVVNFADDSARDAYYDNISHSVTMTTMIYLQPGESVKLPIPFQTLRNYNYCYVDYTVDYPATGGNLPGYDNPIKRYYYFIRDVENIAPSTCRARVELDVWTTYINHATLNNVLLERGHAAMTTTAAQYLASPRDNTDNLLAPDVDYSNGAMQIRGVADIAVNGGHKYLCLACAFNSQQLAAMAAQTPSSTVSTAPTYDANGYVSGGFGYGMGGYDVSNQSAQTAAYQSNSNFTANGTDVYAIDVAAMPAGYIDDIFARYPNIMHGIKAAFICSVEMIALGSTVTVNGVAWGACHGQNAKLADINLNMSNFGYDADIAPIAKLYTYPYAYLEITDNLGQSMQVRVEDTGEMSVQSVVSTAWPTLTAITYLTGIGSDVGTTLSIAPIGGGSQQVTDDNGDIASAMIRYDIPTFSLHLSGLNRKRANGYAVDVQQARSNAITAHDNTLHSANVARANVNASNATVVSNTANSNATAVGNTARANATSNKNTTESRQSAYDITGISNTASSDIMQYGQDNATRIHDVTNLNILNSANLDTSTNTILTDNDNAGTVQQTGAAVLATAATAAIGVGAAAATGGLAVPAIAGVGGALTSAASTGYSSMVGMAKNSAQASAMNASTNGKAQLAESMNDDLTAQHNRYIAQINGRQLQQATDTVNRSNDAAKTINDNTTSMSNANAADSAANSNANATASAATSNANAERSRDNSATVAEINMLNARTNADAAYFSANLSPASDVGAHSGEQFADIIGKRRYMVKIRTQSKNAIRQAGAYFARYGIACNNIVDASTLVSHKYFDYWKVSDMWLTSDAMTTDDINAIKSIMADGVTVWKTPANIGAVSVYDNLGA